MEKIDELKRIFLESRNIVFFGGAGVSTESGIPDFRSSDGLYSMKYKYPPERILSHGFFMEHTAEFYRFYREKVIFPDAKPNAAHTVLARMEKDRLLSGIITQNIDGLHQAAGSVNVLELHGSIRRNYCMKCGRTHNLDKILGYEAIPLCDCGGIIKPDVVLYGEGLDSKIIGDAIELLRHADTLVIGGTSLVVYPAAGLLEYFSGKHLVVINKSKTFADRAASLVIDDSIAKVFAKIYSDGL